MNTIIVTFAVQFAIVRFYAGADADVSFTLASQALAVAGYALSECYSNRVVGNSTQYYHVWTRAVAGDQLDPPVIPNVTWQRIGVTRCSRRTEP